MNFMIPSIIIVKIKYSLKCNQLLHMYRNIFQDVMELAKSASTKLFYCTYDPLVITYSVQTRFIIEILVTTHF